MAREPTIDNLDFATLALDAEQLARLVGERGECVFNWSTREGEPVGVVVAYVFRDERFWTTCAGKRKRVAALRARPQSSVVLNRDGLSATFKGTSRVHSPGEDGWEGLKRWFLPALSGVDPTASEPEVLALLRYLDAPKSIIIETSVHLVVSFDFGRFGAAMTEGMGARVLPL